MNFVMRWGRWLWHLGETPHDVWSASPQMSDVWAAWQRSLHIWPLCPGPLACLMGPVDSGRHAVAQALALRCLQSRQSCFWLQAGAQMGTSHKALAGLWCLRPPSDTAAAIMLEILLRARAAQILVWVLSQPVDMGWLRAEWPRWSALARAAGCSVLVVPPAHASAQMLMGPVWHLADRPWVGSKWAVDRK